MSDVESLDSEMPERFNPTTKLVIQACYDNRCALCLDKLVEEGGECADMLDASEKGASKVALCSDAGIILRDYRTQSLENGILLCARCHKLFSYEYIALCPPKEILIYLVEYVRNTPPGEQMPLYKVLYELSTLNPEGLPDPSGILPYVGLYTLVPLKPAELQYVTISTSFLPNLSVLRNGRWHNAPNGDPTASNVARIFDSLALSVSYLDQHPSPGLIPLHADHPQFSQKRYWRLQHASLPGVLSGVMMHAYYGPAFMEDLEELKQLRLLYGLLVIKTVNISLFTAYFASPGGKGGNEDEGGGGRRGSEPGTDRQVGEEESISRRTRSSTKRKANAVGG